MMLLRGRGVNRRRGRSLSTHFVQIFGVRFLQEDRPDYKRHAPQSSDTTGRVDIARASHM